MPIENLPVDKIIVIARKYKERERLMNTHIA